MARPRRDSETREANTRKKTWKPPTQLPDPDPQEGYVFRWIRTSSMGQADVLNVSARKREGWEPVKAEDHPELQITSDDMSEEGLVVVGGLMLCKASREAMEAREDYYHDLAERQMEGVDNTFLRENDPRMPLLKPYRKSTTTFGEG